MRPMRGDVEGRDTMKRHIWENELNQATLDLDEAQDDVLFCVRDNEIAVVKLTRQQVAEVRDELTRWLDEVAQPSALPVPSDRTE